MRGSGIFSYLAGIIPVVIARVTGGGGEPDPPDPVSRTIEGYAIVGGTDAEIADRYAVELSSLRADFETVLRTSRARGKLSLRRAQWELAMKGNGPMLTWLGRNMLGQSLNPQSPGEREPEFDEKAG